MKIARTKSQKLKLIKQVAKKLNKANKQTYDTHNINHYTDSENYAKKYYGHLYDATTKMDADWD